MMIYVSDGWKSKTRCKILMDKKYALNENGHMDGNY